MSLRCIVYYSMIFVANMKKNIQGEEKKQRRERKEERKKKTFPTIFIAVDIE